MNLVEVDPYRLQAKIGIDLVDRCYSEIDPPTSRSDRSARVWVRSMDNAFVSTTSSETPPIWLYERFRWGPHAWPVRWCDIPNLKHHDCGLMAALSTNILIWRGWQAFPAQFILHFNHQSTRGWASLWRNARITPDWCAGRYAYHEGTAILGANGQMRFWDPLGRFWLPVPDHGSYEGIVALRFNASSPAVPLARCMGEHIRPNKWYCPRFVLSEPKERLDVQVSSP